jgi:hypothetical protein
LAPRVGQEDAAFGLAGFDAVSHEHYKNLTTKKDAASFLRGIPICNWPNQSLASRNILKSVMY